MQDAEARVQVDRALTGEHGLLVPVEQEIAEADDALRDAAHRIERAELQGLPAPLDGSLRIASVGHRHATKGINEHA